MVDVKKLNELYNILDLYIVSSRLKVALAIVEYEFKDTDNFYECWNLNFKFQIDI